MLGRSIPRRFIAFFAKFAKDCSDAQSFRHQTDDTTANFEHNYLREPSHTRLSSKHQHLASSPSRTVVHLEGEYVLFRRRKMAVKSFRPVWVRGGRSDARTMTLSTVESTPSLIEGSLSSLVDTNVCRILFLHFQESAGRQLQPTALFSVI